MNLSLPTDSAKRKNYPLLGGLFGYFGAALAGVAHHSWKNNEKHNPGMPLHWSVDNSNDHADCIARHLLDLHEMIAAQELPKIHPTDQQILDEANALAWRALALCQTLHMKYAGAPLPFNARKTATKDMAAKIESVMKDVAGWPTPRCVRCQSDPCACGPPIKLGQRSDGQHEPDLDNV